MTADLDAGGYALVAWPSSNDTPPAGWRWGRHVSLGARGDGWFLISEAGTTVIAVMRPDLGDDEAPSVDDILAEVDEFERETEACRADALRDLHQLEDSDDY